VLSREIGDRHLEAVALANLGRAYLHAGDLATARERLELALALRVRIPDSHEETEIRSSLAELTRRPVNGSSESRPAPPPGAPVLGRRR
jgi:hypothetical protein